MMFQVVGDDAMQSEQMSTAATPPSAAPPDPRGPDRLISFYYPTLHRLLGRLLSLFTASREVSRVSDYVLWASQRADADAFTLMSRLRDKADELDPLDRAAECFDHMAAGIDTTGDGLCFLMWELSQPRSLRHQRRLADELRRNPDTPLQQLPFLDAVLCESLRCYPPIPMSLRRVVPDGGRTIDGAWVPAGTTVSCQAYSVHRLNADVFPDPDTFDPDRWLAAEGDADRRRVLFAFANGGRGCVGKQ